MTNNLYGEPQEHRSKVCLISVTPDAEKHMGYVARVSNPKNQNNPSVEKLLRYCIKHGHWSVFEQAFMTLEINTTRRNFEAPSYQEFQARTWYVFSREQPKERTTPQL